MSNSLKNKENSALIQLKKTQRVAPPSSDPSGLVKEKEQKNGTRAEMRNSFPSFFCFLFHFFLNDEKNKTNEKRARVRRKTPMATRQSTAEAKSGRRWLVGCRGRRWRHGQWTAWNVAMLFAERDDFEFNKIWFRDGHLGLGSIRRWLTADRPTVH